ncbi:hypothetical protein DFH09DRAFT_1321729 [Mycena vulgaris]|nr:hypothetical protein DFH09DRAFT_1321729 [Mycena vulgaris]
MPPVYTTIAAASNARLRVDKAPPPKQAPTPADQLKEKKKNREKHQADIDEAIGEWRDFTFAKADELAARFDMKAQYFLDIFFQGSARMIYHQEKPNAYNAYKAERAAENRELGVVKKVPELHLDIINDYNLLTDQAKEDLIERHRDLQDRNFNLRRDTPRAKIQDVSNVVRNMKMLMTSLGNCVGMEGFFCVVRNNAEFHMSPEWYFTSPELEGYMPIATRKTWDTGEVGMKLEAFAVAGCQAVNLLRSSRQKADYMKGEIREGMKKMLVDAARDPNAKMSYRWFEEDIVQRYGIVLEGWTPARFVNPSELSTSLVTLRTLLDAIKGGDCAFRRLDADEAVARRKEWDADVAAGKVIAKHRNERSDVGVPRKRRWEDEEAEAHEDDAAAPSTTNDPGDDDTPTTGSSSDPPSTKRARNAKPAAPAKLSATTSARPKKTRKEAAVKDGAPALGDITNKRAARRVVSKATITSEDERDSHDDAPVPRRRSGRRAPALMTSEDEMELDPDADEPTNADAPVPTV